MTTKSKRKHQPRTRFKLKLTLLIFIIGTIIATFYPMIWLAPPLFQLTPFIYIGLSLLWIPILYWCYRRIVFDRLIKALVIGCLLSSIMMTFIFQNISPEIIGCRKFEETYSICRIVNVEPKGCSALGFLVEQYGSLLIAETHPWTGTFGTLCILF